MSPLIWVGWVLVELLIKTTKFWGFQIMTVFFFNSWIHERAVPNSYRCKLTRIKLENYTNRVTSIWYGNSTCKALFVVRFVYLIMTLNKLIHFSERSFHKKARAATTEYILHLAELKILRGNTFTICSTHMVDNVVNKLPLNVPRNPLNWTRLNVISLGAFRRNKEILVLC